MRARLVEDERAVALAVGDALGGAYSSTPQGPTAHIRGREGWLSIPMVRRTRHRRRSRSLPGAD
jgi:hypothetical protein